MPRSGETLVLHGATARTIAVRLAMDLRSDGIEAHPLPLQHVGDDEWNADLPGVTGLVLVYDGRTWIAGAAYDSLFRIHPERPIVFVRSRSSRFAPDFQRFHTVPLFDSSSFSHYQPDSEG